MRKIYPRHHFAARFPRFLVFAESGRLFSEAEGKFPKNVATEIQRFFDEEGVVSPYEFYFDNFGNVVIYWA